MNLNGKQIIASGIVVILSAVPIWVYGFFLYHTELLPWSWTMFSVIVISAVFPPVMLIAGIMWIMIGLNLLKAKRDSNTGIR